MPSELADLLRTAQDRRRDAHAVPVAQQPRPWFRMETKPAADGQPKTADVWIYDTIGESWFGDSTDAKSFTAQLRDLDVDEIALHINSPGGDYFDGVAIYNALVDHKATVNAVVDGLAASAASFIFQAGDTRRVNRAGQVMIHDASGIVVGNSSDMASMVDLLDKISDSIAGIYAARGGGSVEDWRTAMRAETWYTAAEAVDAGLADESVAEAPPEPPVRNSWDLSIFNFAGRDKAPTPSMHKPPAPPGPPPEGSTPVEITDEQLIELRTKAGVGNDASLADTLAALNKAPEKPGDKPADKPANEPPATSNAAVPAGMRIVADSVWEEQQKTIENLRKFVERKQRDERDEVLNQAIRDGKFTPTQRKQFSDLWDESPERARNLIDSLTRNQALAVNELGHAGYDISDEAAEDAEFDSMFPPEMRYSGKGR